MSDQTSPAISKAGGILATVCLFLLIAAGIAQAADDAGFAGSASCAQCHPAETSAWSRSDHGWALREATAANVLGDFKDATFSHKGVTTTFSTRDGRNFVETDGTDGKLRQYEVRYSVGVRPLQQYLVETESGRLQVLDVAWDAEQGKWYHLYPQDDVAAGNGLHWTGTYKNWQGRCAECHQTGFEKGYDFASRSYKSHWAELTVSCESCHGPSSGHVAAARQSPKPDILPSLRLGIGEQANELAVCGPCHARREAFSQSSAPVGGRLGDHYNLSLLGSGLYFADGQQDGEVFILGSFLQSKMMAKGVTCSNCHEPHGNGLVAEGNAICTQCHSPAGQPGFPTLSLKDYDSPAHHHHAQGSAAAQCVNCHMPDRAYMVIDKRRDHFFRRPDPLQSKAAGAPDVCTGCHTEKAQDWAARAIAGWFPNPDLSWQDRSAFTAFHGGDRSAPALQSLADFARDLERPPIARASAIEALRSTGGTAELKQSLAPLLADPSDLVRTAATGLMREAAPEDRAGMLKPLLADPSRNVRQAAAAELAGSAGPGMAEADLALLSKALAEYQASRLANADMPEAHMALAGLALSTRNWAAAEAAFKEAASMDPQLEEAWVMLVRLSAALGDDARALDYLDKGLAVLPRGVGLMFERAGLESRRGDERKAIDWYRRIIAGEPDNIEAWLGMASAALRARDSGIAIDAAAKVIALQPGNVDAHVISAIAFYTQGNVEKARALAARARELNPGVQLPGELEALL